MSTTFDAEALTNAADTIGGLMDDMSAFDKLKNHWPNAGDFKLAVWMERLVDDRRNAIIAHAEHLKIAFGKMQEKLSGIATDFQNADGDNADAINKAMSELEGSVVDAVHSYDSETESEQHNHTPDTAHTGFSPNNPHDGDGYNDNLNDAVST